MLARYPARPREVPRHYGAARVGTPLSMTSSAARAQAAQVQRRRPAGSIARDQVKGDRAAEAGRPQTVQQVLEVMSMTLVRHRVGLATDR